MNHSKDTPHTPKELLAELKTLAAEAKTMMADSLSEHSGEVLANLRARFDVAQDRLTDFYEGAKKKVVAGAKCADETIRENPYQSLAIALGVGVLLGVVMVRRGK